MRDAAQRFLGEHDFRNFCKVGQHIHKCPFVAIIKKQCCMCMIVRWTSVEELPTSNGQSKALTSAHLTKGKLSLSLPPLYLIILLCNAVLLHRTKCVRWHSWVEHFSCTRFAAWWPFSSWLVMASSSHPLLITCSTSVVAPGNHSMAWQHRSLWFSMTARMKAWNGNGTSGLMRKWLPTFRACGQWKWWSKWPQYTLSWHRH